MNKYSQFVFLILLINSCNSKHENQINKDSELVNIIDFEQKKSDTIQESNYIAIFDEESGKNSNLTNVEIEIVNNNLANAVEKYNDELKTKLQKWNKEDKSMKWNYDEEKLNLRYYFRQYKVSADKNGDKIVRVLCFCAYFGNWKTEIMSVHDGGDCYLNVKINVTKNRTEYFGTNGLA